MSKAKPSSLYLLGFISFTPTYALKNSASVVEMAVSDPEHFTFTSDYVLKVSLLTDRSAGSPLVQTRNILKEIARRAG